MRFDLALVMVYNKLLETDTDSLVVSVAFASAKEAVLCDFHNTVMTVAQIVDLIGNTVNENYSLCKLVELRDSATSSDDLNRLRLLSTAAKQYALLVESTLEEVRLTPGFFLHIAFQSISKLLKYTLFNFQYILFKIKQILTNALCLFPLCTACREHCGDRLNP